MLFKQKRYGFNNELIEVYKFRSMYVDQCRRHRRQAASPRTIRASPASAASSARPALDELPQLFNVVFKGNLSLVGPRPHAVARQGRRTGSTTRRSTAISPATASSPASPAGRRSTAGAARPTPTRRSSARRARPLLHRELVGAVRPLHPGDDAVRAAQDRERLLMIASHPRASAGEPSRRAARIAGRDGCAARCCG